MQNDDRRAINMQPINARFCIDKFWKYLPRGAVGGEYKLELLAQKLGYLEFFLLVGGSGG